MENQVKSFMFGQSQSGLPMVAHRFGGSGPSVLILGGVHGDEVEGVIAAQGLLGRFMNSFTYKLNLTLVPCFNIDGVNFNQRQNAHDVDLNRNLPTNDWSEIFEEKRYNPGSSANSEPENQALVSWLEDNKPRLVLSLHSWNPLLTVNGGCQPEAEVISKLTGYQVADSIGYPTPGCLGTYCGIERDMPTLTYEIERGLNSENILKTHVPAILEALKVTEERF